MDQPTLETPVKSETAEFNEQLGALDRQITFLLLALLIASSTVTLFLFLQVRRARNDLNEFKPQAVPVVEASKRVGDFIGKLTEYGRTHPDFVPVLLKYRIPVATAAPPAAATVPKPAAAPAPKK